ncbi:serine hydrolase [candidate division LCP-89 bacterium B3_LCP]|uniref:Serine hydrolase n=1 Tax=candidate division LCP-89 bacterium B3_LCP TaxID=2012998 RepID=A0A532V268_UNCL8|nr:MAG: serine hydrolase [candidate division LCP-89 bacterium B3_LCP]
MLLKEKLHPILQELADRDKFSGVILINRDNEDLFSGAYGYASRRWRIINSTDMVYPTASVTKMFTAVAVLQLIEKGMLSLNSKVQNLLKLNVSNLPSNVTVRHLLTHTSGIADYFDETDDDADAYRNIWRRYPNYALTELEDMLPLFAGKDPQFNAGDDFSYCNAGYILLGLVIEHVTDESYFNCIRKNVLLEAGMKDSDFISLDRPRENVADGHSPIYSKDGSPKGWKTNIYSLPVNGSADGGAHSTAEDLVKFLQALRTGVLLSDQMTSEILKIQSPVQEDDSGRWAYGYGIAFLLDDDEVVRYGHSGDDPGVSAKLFHYPDLDVDLVILGNQSHCANEAGDRVHEVIMEVG